ncbi:hypothetical protein [Paracoccus laeviglucosivorans]|uniref:hypothetical protein n=1 Tax=Paracoccus laeviglucosivorans TaxID=1197861 RepID=UPI00163DD84C|nr:hypothetical protein [Paracoccus laeviglucosivorans]
MARWLTFASIQMRKAAKQVQSVRRATNPVLIATDGYARLVAVGWDVPYSRDIHFAVFLRIGGGFQNAETGYKIRGAEPHLRNLTRDLFGGSGTARDLVAGVSGLLHGHPHPRS